MEKYSYIGEICTRYPHADSMLIDIPIGLVESREELRPDSLVKKELGKKGSSIFETPCRQAIYSKDKHAARENNIRVLGKSLSEQSLAISNAIRQVDEFLQQNPEWKNKLTESHPELCFAKLNSNQPVLENKHTKEGEQKRLEILQRYYPEARLVVDKYLADVPYRKKTDDVIDALCLAATGMIGCQNGFSTIPENRMRDKHGLRMQMVCPVI